MPVYTRISGRLGNTIDLNTIFYRNGIPDDPYAVRRIKIYKSSVQDENLIAQINVSLPDATDYPYPLSREIDSGGLVKPGVFHFFWAVPSSGIVVPDTFFDVWEYIGPAPSSVSSFDPTDESMWNKACNQFWLYTDGFFVDDDLETIKIAFEAQDRKFYKPEVRTMEVGIMPMPLYDYDYNLVAPIIPQLLGTIRIMTDNAEVLVHDEPMTMKLVQGTYRTNPFVLTYKLDTNNFLKGSYKYQVMVRLPNGETRSSPWFSLSIG